ncbi:aldo/keto reductase [Frankia sp. AgPm24]|uniref:aldo/keto reductase n=1 Tax=Frankia sp. AgPm24 TaxID=631128 RepID=UPI00200E2379|nr:aldo/keto reductase [Frankia sp. AgPm24]MCK9920657.1 aldo/keto reductase [Frankia sp. AgPm24]
MIGRRAVGRSGLRFSALSLGGMTLGHNAAFGAIGADATEAARIVARALDAGIDTFDTANVYGESEHLLGRLLASRRDDVVLCTKVRFPTAVPDSGAGGAGGAGDGSGGGAAGGGPPPASSYGLSRGAVLRAVEGSLRRLGTDYLDVLWLHMQDRSVPIAETLATTDTLVRQGKVRYVGLSNFMAYRVAEAVCVAGARGYEAPVGLQLPWSAVGRGVERELVPAARHFELGVAVYSPLARGLLSGKYERGREPVDGSRLALWKEELAGRDTDRTWAVLAALRGIAADHRVPVAAVALAWVLARRPVASVIVGVRTAEQLEQNLAAARLRLSREETARIDAVSEPDWDYPESFIGRFEAW